MSERKIVGKDEIPSHRLSRNKFEMKSLQADFGVLEMVDNNNSNLAKDLVN